MLYEICHMRISTYDSSNIYRSQSTALYIRKYNSSILINPYLIPGFIKLHGIITKSLFSTQRIVILLHRVYNLVSVVSRDSYNQ